MNYSHLTVRSFLDYVIDIVNFLHHCVWSFPILDAFSFWGCKATPRYLLQMLFDLNSYLAFILPLRFFNSFRIKQILSLKQLWASIYSLYLFIPWTKKINLYCSVVHPLVFTYDFERICYGSTMSTSWRCNRVMLTVFMPRILQYFSSFVIQSFGFNSFLLPTARRCEITIWM